MSARPRKPKTRRKEPPAALKELNKFAQGLAKKARADMMAGDISEDANNGPFLDSNGRIGGPFSIGAIGPGDIVSNWKGETFLRDNSGWVQVDPASIIRVGVEQSKPKQETPQSSSIKPDLIKPDPIKPSRFGRMIKLQEKEEQEEKE